MNGILLKVSIILITITITITNTTIIPCTEYMETKNTFNIKGLVFKDSYSSLLIYNDHFIKFKLYERVKSWIIFCWI